MNSTGVHGTVFMCVAQSRDKISTNVLAQLQLFFSHLCDNLADSLRSFGPALQYDQLKFHFKCQTSLDFKSWFKFIASRYHCVIYGINIHEFRSRSPAGQSTSLQVLDSARGIILDDTHLVPLLTASAILPLKCK